MMVSVFQPPWQPGTLSIRARMEGDGVLGDAMWELTPGQFFLGWSFDELLQQSGKMVDLEPKPGPARRGEVFAPYPVTS